MSGVDVLAVMLTQQKHDESRGLWEPAAVMETARAAVAELIEADIEFDEANLAWDVAPGFAQSIGDTDGRDFDGPEYERLYKAIHRRAEAIERVIGGKA